MFFVAFQANGALLKLERSSLDKRLDSNQLLFPNEKQMFPKTDLRDTTI